ncbi:AAA family ATPase [Xanthomonas campestris pv. badrii]|uniref:AAA family ATPase n=1 Tax=Xanthomonas campestris pv. badrii TaxID=149696 RepID=A0A7Z2VCX6_XANCA|nr:ATP-binding protein [Xanthomonas campestris]QJD69264.1 AAA family ATPase [Xanthomonas campestris pv. badrii]
MKKIDEKQLVAELSAQNERLMAELVQVSRLGARGDAERLRIQVLRFIRTLRAEGNELAELLQAAVFGHEEGGSHPSVARATRLSKPPPRLSMPVPSDGETRLDLLRVEDPPILPHPLVQAPEVMRELTTLITERRSLQRLADLGLEPAKAVLFTGPPGVGKTLAARMIARELRLPLLVLDLASVISSYLGRTGNNIKQAFEFAKRTPCVLFLDELDAVAKRRDDEADVGELKRLVTVLLQELDLWSPKNLLLAATNHRSLLDPAVWRRFDVTIDFPLPEASELANLGQLLSPKNDPLSAGWIKTLAVLSEGTSQSDFVRDINRLRRAALLGDPREQASVFESFIATKIERMKISERKKLAVSLVKNAKLSQREASKVASVARETLRTALQE